MAIATSMRGLEKDSANFQRLAAEPGITPEAINRWGSMANTKIAKQGKAIARVTHRLENEKFDRQKELRQVKGELAGVEETWQTLQSGCDEIAVCEQDLKALLLSRPKDADLLAPVLSVIKRLETARNNHFMLGGVKEGLQAAQSSLIEREQEVRFQMQGTEMMIETLEKREARLLDLQVVFDPELKSKKSEENKSDFSDESVSAQNSSSPSAIELQDRSGSPSSDSQSRASKDNSEAVRVSPSDSADSEPLSPEPASPEPEDYFSADEAPATPNLPRSAQASVGEEPKPKEEPKPSEPARGWFSSLYSAASTAKSYLSSKIIR